MRSRARAGLVLAIAAVAGGCRSQADAANADTVLSSRAKEVQARIAAARADTSGDATPVARWMLPDVLREISGIAVTSDGRILAHNDERGQVYVVDPHRGVIVKQFSLGARGIAGDFEAIAVSGSEIYMLTSNGRIYQFREGEDGGSVPFREYDSRLGKECEFEGLAIEPGNGAFLMLCKVIARKSQRDQILIYKWDADAAGPAAVSTISVPLAEAVGANGWKQLSPSDITIDPVTGNYVVIAGRQKALVELTADGNVVRSFPLPGNPQQPEGVAVTRDGILIVGDEGVSRPADITLYPWRRAGGTAPPQAKTDSAGSQQENGVSAG